MENDVLSRVLVVTSPLQLAGNDHASSIDGLCKHHTLVILMHFGDEQYELPVAYCLPHNAKVVYYDYESLDFALEQLENYLNQYGIDMISRHENGPDRLPFVLGGSILRVPSDVQLSFFTENTPKELTKTVSTKRDEWDL